MPNSSAIAEKIKSDSTVGISPGAPFMRPVPKKLPQLMAKSENEKKDIILSQLLTKDEKRRKFEELGVDILVEFGVRRCYYGHVHGNSIPYSFAGTYKGIEFRLVSADNLQFRPLLVE